MTHGVRKIHRAMTVALIWFSVGQRGVAPKVSQKEEKLTGQHARGLLSSQEQTPRLHNGALFLTLFLHEAGVQFALDETASISLRKRLAWRMNGGKLQSSVLFYIPSRGRLAFR